MSDINSRLKAWGDYICRHLDYADEYGESILHRYSEYGYTDSQPSGHKILCPDMPPHIRKVDLAVKKLKVKNELMAKCLWLHYCAPLRPDNNPYTCSQLARMLSINKGAFRAWVRKGKRAVESAL